MFGIKARMQKSSTGQLEETRLATVHDHPMNANDMGAAEQELTRRSRVIAPTLACCKSAGEGTGHPARLKTAAWLECHLDSSA